MLAHDLAFGVLSDCSMHAAQAAELYFQACLRTLHREWFGIDRLRLDKFMMLVRTFVKAMWCAMRDADW